MNTGKCSNHESPLEELKSYEDGKKRLRGPTMWKDMLKNALKDAVNWQAKRQNIYTKSQLPALMITTSRRTNWNRLENCQKYQNRAFTLRFFEGKSDVLGELRGKNTLTKKRNNKNKTKKTHQKNKNGKKEKDEKKGKNGGNISNRKT